MTVVVVSTGGAIAMRAGPATGKLVPAVPEEEPTCGRGGGKDL